MDKIDRKAIKDAYANRKVVGGIYCVTCSGNGRKWIKSTVDMESIRKRFEFSLKIGGAPDPSMQSEWLQYGADSFSFTCLEELEKGETQTQREFAADIKVLYELWLEKGE